MAKGRKPIKITNADLKKIETLAARGLMDKEIMAMMGWSHDFFYKKKRELSDFNDAIERGRASGHSEIANRLWEAANNGNITAITYYLARRAGWTEKSKEVDEKDSEPLTINFNVSDPVDEINITRGK